MKNFTRIAMIATKEDWESIENYFSKDDILGINSRIDTEFPYLINYHDENDKFGIGHYNTVGSEAIHETFNAKIFLEACGIETDVYKITKEQVLGLSEKFGNDNYTGLRSGLTNHLKSVYPDAFKKEFETGKWYKCNYTDSIITENKSLIFISEIDGKNINGYGFDFQGEWFDKKRDCGTINEHYQEATQKEVEDALICEAKKRGYKKGVLVKPLWKTPLDSWNVYDNQIRFEGKSNVFYFGCCIFKDGIWATIIQPEKMTLEQIEKELGRKIELI